MLFQCWDSSHAVLFKPGCPTRAMITEQTVHASHELRTNPLVSNRRLKWYFDKETETPGHKVPRLSVFHHTIIMVALWTTRHWKLLRPSPKVISEILVDHYQGESFGVTAPIMVLCRQQVFVFVRFGVLGF